MTLANWPPVCRLMSESWTEWWMLFALTHKLVIGLLSLEWITSAPVGLNALFRTPQPDQEWLQISFYMFRAHKTKARNGRLGGQLLQFTLAL
eukprot:834930-Amphidinium_carterae.1